MSCCLQALESSIVIHAHAHTLKQTCLKVKINTPISQYVCVCVCV